METSGGKPRTGADDITSDLSLAESSSSSEQDLENKVVPEEKQFRFNSIKEIQEK